MRAAELEATLSKLERHLEGMGSVPEYHRSFLRVVFNSVNLVLELAEKVLLVDDRFIATLWNDIFIFNPA